MSDTKKYVDLDGLSHFKSKCDSKYVSKDGTKVLSDNNYTDAEKTKLAGLSNYDDTQIQAAVANKVDKVTGKGLSTEDYTTAEKTKLSGIETGAEVNIIEEIEVNGTAATISGKKASVTVAVGDIASISVNGTPQTIDVNKNVDITVPTNNNQLTNGAGYQTANDVDSAIDAKISSTYKAKGSVAFANLPALSSSREGFVYNITDAFTTTSDFVEGAGKSYPAGTNVVIINNGTEQNPSYKYDVLTGFVDLSGYVQTSDLVAITNAEIDAIFAD